MQVAGALRRDSGTAVEVAADRTAAKISILFCKSPCCLMMGETGPPSGRRQSSHSRPYGS